jgi:hypothetical protein
LLTAVLEGWSSVLFLDDDMVVKTWPVPRDSGIYGGHVLGHPDLSPMEWFGVLVGAWHGPSSNLQSEESAEAAAVGRRLCQQDFEALLRTLHQPVDGPWLSSSEDEVSGYVSGGAILLQDCASLSPPFPPGTNEDTVWSHMASELGNAVKMTTGLAAEHRPNYYKQLSAQSVLRFELGSCLASLCRLGLGESSVFLRHAARALLKHRMEGLSGRARRLRSRLEWHANSELGRELNLIEHGSKHMVTGFYADSLYRAASEYIPFNRNWADAMERLGVR